MKYLKLFKLKNIYIIILIFCSANVHAQIFNWTTLDSNIAKQNGYWYCDSTAQYQEAYPHLNCMPPLSTDMPYDILLSYIYTDSLMRHLSRDAFFDKISYWKENHIKNDTVIKYIKYFYLMQDYNPIKLKQYKNEQSSDFYNFNISSLYTTGELLESIAFDSSYYYSLINIQQPEYLLRVKINTIIDSGLSKEKSVDPNRMLYYVNATVIDTLKGKFFKDCRQYYPTMKDKDIVLNELPQICFTYVNGPYASDDYKNDTSMVAYNGNLILKPNQEMIIALAVESPLFDYDYDYFGIHLLFVIPIFNNQVKDINYIWSDSILLDYDAWKTIFVQRKQMLLDGKY